MAIVTELVTKFSFKGSTKPLLNFNKTLLSSIKSIAKVTAGLTAVVSGIGLFTIATLSSAESLNKLSRETGLSIESIQELGFAASLSGSDAATFESSILSLSKTIGKAAQFGSADFSRLGVSVRDSFGNIKSADDVLLEVGKRFKELNLSLPEQQSFASSLGIDASLLTLLSKSGREIDILRVKARKLGIVTKEDGKQIQNFNDGITVLKFSITSLQKRIAIGLAPTVLKLTDSFTNFLEANKQLISNGIAKVGEALAVIINVITRLFTLVSDIIKATVGWKVVIIALGIAIAAALSPVLALTAGITAILLVVDDLIVAFQGGKSFIRDFFQEFLGFDITPVIQNIVQGFKDGIEQIKNFFKSLFKFVDNLFSGISRIVKGIKNFFSGGSSKKAEVNQTNIAQITPSSAGIGSQVNTNNNSVNQQVQIDVRSTDPAAAGISVRDSLQNEIKNASLTINQGGR